MKIFVASYTYIHENNFEVFDYFKNKSDLFFVLPKKWRSTKGTRKTTDYRGAGDFESIPSWAPFFHSKYPLIHGQLKGWMPNLGNILRKNAKKGDVLYSSYEPNLLVTYLYSRLARKLGMKHVFFSWQNVPYRDRMGGLKLKYTDWILRENIRLSAGGLFGMEKAYEIHKPYLEGNNNLKIGIMSQTGINIDQYRPGIKTDFLKRHELENKIIILYAATFTERKGTLPTLEAFSKICGELPSAHLLMIGTGGLERQLKDRVIAMKLSARVTILPWQPVSELAQIYSQSHMLVHPSEPFMGWEEQWGMLMLHAQSCGIPVITTRSGSLEETVLDGKTGILVKPGGDIDGIAAAMRLLVENDVLRTSMGQKGREYIINHFSNESIAERMESYMQSL